MSNPFIGEIRIFGGNFAPAGWAFCDGQILPISENEALFILIGTTYGGDGQTTFALPDLRGRLPMHQGQGPGLSARTLAEQAGVERVTLTAAQVPIHDHAVNAVAGLGTRTSPIGNVWAAAGASLYTNAAPSAPLNPAALASAGGGQSHENMSPFLGVSFIISLFGIFPSQS